MNNKQENLKASMIKAIIADIQEIKDFNVIEKVYTTVVLEAAKQIQEGEGRHVN